MDVAGRGGSAVNVVVDEYEAMRAMDPVTLLRAVVTAGRNAGYWNTAQQFARNELVRDPRTVRRWLSDVEKDRVDIPAIVLDRLAALALELKVDRENPDIGADDGDDA